VVIDKIILRELLTKCFGGRSITSVLNDSLAETMKVRLYVVVSFVD